MSRKNIAVALGVVLALLVSAGAVVYFLVGWMKSSWPYQAATFRAQNHPAVVRTVGEPVKFGLPVGRIEERNDTGRAELDIRVSGPRGEGRLTLVAKRDDGKWDLAQLSFSGNGPVVDLLLPEGAASGAPSQAPDSGP